jgi:hypothetical protein
MSSVAKQMHNLNARVYASSFCETYSQGPAASGFFRNPASMGRALMTGPVTDSLPPAGPNTEIFFGLTGGYSGASIHGRPELQGGSPISDPVLAALQGASISFGMPGMQPLVRTVRAVDFSVDCRTSTVHGCEWPLARVRAACLHQGCGGDGRVAPHPPRWSSPCRRQQLGCRFPHPSLVFLSKYIST